MNDVQFQTVVTKLAAIDEKLRSLKMAQVEFADDYKGPRVPAHAIGSMAMAFTQLGSAVGALVLSGAGQVVVSQLAQDHKAVQVYVKQFESAMSIIAKIQADIAPMVQPVSSPLV